MLVLLLPGLAAARRVAQSCDQTWPVRSRALGMGSSAPIPAVRKADRNRDRSRTGVQIMGRTQSLHAEIGAPHPIVGGQGPMRAFENDPTGF